MLGRGCTQHRSFTPHAAAVGTCRGSYAASTAFSVHLDLDGGEDDRAIPLDNLCSYTQPARGLGRGLRRSRKRGRGVPSASFFRSSTAGSSGFADTDDPYAF